MEKEFTQSQLALKLLASVSRMKFSRLIVLKFLASTLILENVTVAGNGFIKQFKMQEVGKAKQKYREIKSHFKRNDHRILTKISEKYGKLQANKSQSEIHKIHGTDNQTGKETLCRNRSGKYQWNS
jgi:hypothetical protein